MVALALGGVAGGYEKLHLLEAVFHLAAFLGKALQIEEYEQMVIDLLDISPLTDGFLLLLLILSLHVFN